MIDSFINTPLDYGMLSAARRLKEKYSIGMVTDNKVDRMEIILKHNGLTDLFDVVTISAQCKCGKNERKIFDTALDTLQVEPHECIFIDNSEKNLIVPREMGIHTIWFDDENRDLDVVLNKISELLDI